MNKLIQKNDKHLQSIEMEYINSMLGITETVVSVPSAAEAAACEQVMTETTVTVTTVTETASGESLVNEPVIIDNNPQPDPFDFSKAYEKPEIECRVFTIAGMQLAIPSAHIQQTQDNQKIIKTDATTAPSAMHLGTIQLETTQHQEHITVIDLTYLMMNDINNFQSEIDLTKTSNTIVLLEGCSMAFIYNDVIQHSLVDKQQIHWRDAQSQRTWLAGTVKKMGLAILDVKGLIKLFNTADLP